MPESSHQSAPPRRKWIVRTVLTVSIILNLFFLPGIIFLPGKLHEIDFDFHSVSLPPNDLIDVTAEMPVGTKLSHKEIFSVVMRDADRAFYAVSKDCDCLVIIADVGLSAFGAFNIYISSHNARFVFLVKDDGIYFDSASVYSLMI